MNTLNRKLILLASLCAVFATIVPTSRAQHGLLREIYTGIQAGQGIPGLLNAPSYPNNPVSVSVIPEFEAPDSFGDNYGQRIRGWIKAPQTGSYTFWLASDDQGQLFLSSGDRAENRRIIAEVMGWTDPRNYETEPNQRSAPIRLEEGVYYYIEALMVEGGGGDHISVRWQLPDGTIEDPIAGEHLFVELIPPQIAQQPRNLTAPEGAAATFSLQLANRGAVDVQWLRNDVPIPGATNLSYTLPAVSLSDNGSRFRVSLSNVFATNLVLSAPAFLTVVRDTTPPTLVAAQTSGENGLLTIAFSEPLSLNTATNPANYQISGGVQVLSGTVDASGRTVILQTTPFTFGETYFVVVENVQDRASQPNSIELDTQAEFSFGYTPLSPEAVYGRSETPGPSTRRTGLTFSEIMYEPAPRDDDRNLEYIEIFNSEPSIVNLGGYRITGEVEYTFPEGTFLSANSYAVVAQEPQDMQTIYGLSRVYGPFQGTLGGSGTLQLLNDQGAVLLDLSYQSGGEWPSAPDGAGHSLVLARPSYGEADPRAWGSSDSRAGSPGRPEAASPNPYRSVVINEFLANSDLPQVDFVEFYNYSNQSVDLSGVWITDSISSNKFRIPSGTVIGPRGFLSFNEATLGFALGSDGERIIVRNPQRTQVLQSVKFGPQAAGVSVGRFPDGNPELRPLVQPTPGAANLRPQLPPVVISEIMYNPLSGDDEEQYVELMNRTTSAINVGGWRIEDGIAYTFPSGTILPPGSHMVVAKNVALLRANHSNTVTAANSVGDFSGNLSNSGERIVLERPEFIISTSGTQRVTNMVFVVVNEVSYKTGGRWPQWADGGGSSMELIDPHSDNSKPSNWADSDETQKAPWVTIERRGILDYGSTNHAPTNPSRNLHVLLADEGEALLDNVQVSRDGGANLIRNPGFDRGLSDWLVGGTHDESTIETNIQGGNVLHIRAAGRGDTAANRVRVRLSEGLTNGSIATIRADVRWLRGTPDILLRLHGNYLEAPGQMVVPKNLGTPGAPNSRAVPNSHPIITAVEHSPILPVALQPVEVRAQLEDPDRVALAALYYRVDPATNFVRVAMQYRGAGFYSGSIPGQTNLTSVGFYIEAIDARGGIARFPENAPQSTGVIVFGDGTPEGNLGVYRLWLTQTNINRWATRERSSNKAVDSTFVYNRERVIYNMGALYSGSPFHWNNYNSPLGNNANYVMVFPDDDLFLGQNDFVLNLPSNLGSDNTRIREQIFFWMADQLNQPFNYRRFHHLFLNGRNRGQAGGAFEDSQQPNRDFIDQWYPNDPDGALHKIEDWFEFDDNALSSRFNIDADLVAIWTTNLTTGLPELKQERYRWWFRKRGVRDSHHDFSELFRLVRAVNEPDQQRFIAQVDALIDIDEWLGVIALRHIAGDWDAFGNDRGKNMYAYKPQNGKWQLMHWDVAFAFGNGGDGTRSDLFKTIESSTARILQVPQFRRAYYRALQEAANGPLISSRVNAVIDTKFNAIVENGINATAPQEVKEWIAERRAYVVEILANVDAAFAITSNRGANYTTNRNSVLLTGTAPVTVKTIQVNGVEYPVTWTSETAWQIRLALQPQQNNIQIQGYDSKGAPIASASTGITITLTSQPEPMAGKVVINEIMYNPAAPDSGFIEIHNSARNTSYDLSGYRLNGADFAFPGGTVIPPGGFLVVAKSAVSFGDRYGYTIPLAGEYAGRLQDGGETLSLVTFDVTGTNEVIIAAVDFDDVAPWPDLADGTGASLQLIDPTQDASRVGNWTAAFGAATPGATNSVRANLPPFPAVWLNEVQPNNVTGLRDSAGDRDPWVEIYNSSSSAISLAGLFLTDDYNQLTKWPFPANASLAPGQRLMVWLDGEASESAGAELHTSFRIAPSQGSVALVGMPGGIPRVFDYLSFGDIPAGYSYGAFPEGQAVWRARFFIPTPAQENSLSSPPVAVFINEWMASNSQTVQDPDDGDFDDWFELYNAGNEPADISGYTLTDDLDDPAQSTIPNGTIIPARGYLLVWADSENAPAGVHANFRLSAGGEVIALFAPSGSLIDSVEFGAQDDDVSGGRLPDGGAVVAVLPFPTPGASNGGVDPDALQFTSVIYNGGEFTLNWNGTAGETYRIEYKNSLADATWTLLRTVTATGSGATTVDAVSGPHRFYRIVQE